MLLLRLDPPDRIAGRCGKVDRPEPAWLQCCGNPEAARGTTLRPALVHGSFGFASAKGFELGRGCAARAHELHYVEHPLRVFVEQRKLHRPDRTRGRVTAHEGTAEKHALGTDDDRGAFGVLEPTRGFDAAHEDMDVLGPGEHPLGHARSLQPAEPLPDRLRRLFDERLHRQTPDKPPWRCPGGTHPMCRPTKRNPCRLAGSRRRDQNLGLFIRREPPLPAARGRIPPERKAVEVCDIRAVHSSGAPSPLHLERGLSAVQPRSTSNATTLRASLLNSTAIKWIGWPEPRYLSA